MFAEALRGKNERKRKIKNFNVISYKIYDIYIYKGVIDMSEIKRNYDADDFVFEAKTNGELLAELHGKIAEGVFNISGYDGDKYLFDGVCRAALNNAEHEGAKSAVIEESVPEWLLMLFGYKREIPSVAEFFENDKCDGCGKCGG